MKWEKIKESFKRDFDRFDAFLLIIPIVLFVGGNVFHNRISYHIYILIPVFLFAMTLLPVVATNYCYRDDRSRFEKGLFIFLSFCSLVILVYYSLFSGQPALDTFVKWSGNILLGALWLLTMVFLTIWGHKYGKLSSSDTTVKIPKAPVEWSFMLLLIASILWVK